MRSNTRATQYHNSKTGTQNEYNRNNTIAMQQDYELWTQEQDTLTRTVVHTIIGKTKAVSYQYVQWSRLVSYFIMGAACGTLSPVWIVPIFVASWKSQLADGLSCIPSIAESYILLAARGLRMQYGKAGATRYLSPRTSSSTIAKHIHIRNGMSHAHACYHTHHHEPRTRVT